MSKVYTVAPGTDDERKLRVEVNEENPNRFIVTLDLGTEHEKTVELDAKKLPSGAYHVLWGNRSLELDLFADEDNWTVSLDGQSRELLLLNDRKLAMRRSKGGAAGADGPDLNTPMAGKIVKYLVDSGDTVEAGQGVVIVEAMKMENELKAHRDGTVTDICAEEGAAVEVGATLLRIEADE